MRDFFKFMFASMVGYIVLGLLFFLFVLILIPKGGSEKAAIKQDSVLHIKLDRFIAERAAPQDIDLDIAGLTGSGAIGLDRLLESIRAAENDDKIKGIYLDLSVVMANSATLEEIREAILEFRKSGKWVISYAEFYTQGSYYLASAADKVYMFPEGVLDFRGLNADVWFVKGLAEKLGVEIQVIRGKNNKFKSAVEPFMLDQMSEANREQTEAFISSIWGTILRGVSEERGIEEEKLNQIADDLSTRDSQDALDLGMIDELKYKDEILQELRDSLGLASDDKIASVSLERYGKVKGRAKYGSAAGKSEGKIAVVFAVGEIASGEGDNSETMGSEKIARAIRKVRTDSTVKAVVLRINSPGGSALASDVIWREAVLTQKEKPLVVSMGDVAASGGYYIACPADKIFARENTITGSIGVFGMIPNAQEMFEDKLGMRSDNVKTNRNADLFTLTQPLTEEQYVKIQEMVEDTYDDFLTRVADGRNMDKSAVDSIGQGRVWTGKAAMDLGLVDAIGGLDDAIAEAASLAEIESYRIRKYPKMDSPWEEVVRSLGQMNVTEAVAEEAADELGVKSTWKELKSIISLGGIQARLPFSISIR